MADTETDAPSSQPIDVDAALAENALARAELMEAIDALPAARLLDEWNEARVEEARGLGWEQTLGRLRAAREAFDAAARAAAESLPPERMTAGRTAARLITENGAEHDREHGGQILAWRREQQI